MTPQGNFLSKANTEQVLLRIKASEISQIIKFQQEMIVPKDKASGVITVWLCFQAHISLVWCH